MSFNQDVSQVVLAAFLWKSEMSQIYNAIESRPRFAEFGSRQ